MASCDGIILVDKPAGMTSFGAVALARRALTADAATGRGVRCGHAGSLDPLATGLLLLMAGAGTRLSSFLMGLDKTYRFTVRFGAGTDTLDAEGEVTGRADVSASPADLAGALADFRGRILQVPPVFSALKRDGQPLHKLARAGGEVAPPAPRSLLISTLALDAVRWGETPAADAAGAADGLLYEADLTVACSSGTYVRALARDLAARLGTLGHVRALRRTRIGPFELAEALPGDRLVDGAALRAALRPLRDALPHLPGLALAAEEARSVRRGAQPPRSWLARLAAPPAAAGGALVALRDEGGGLVAVARIDRADGPLRLAAVFGAEER